MRPAQPILTALLLLLAGCADGGGDTNDGADDGDGTGSTGGGGGGDDGDGNQTDGNETMPEEVSLEVSLSGIYPTTIAYDPATLTVPAGAVVTLTFTNDDQNPVPRHDWVLEGYEQTASTAVLDNGESDTITFTAPTEPGDYAFYCSVQGHRGNGMEGTLTVTAE